MGILDDAIREHLDLKRQHGAEESEVEGLEAEAFGPADRPDATEAPQAGDEALAQVISPGSALTVPAGEGDQLDKVFEATAQKDSEAEREGSADEHELPDVESAPDDAAHEPAESDSAPDRASEVPASPAVEREEDDGEGDAGDALERERQHLAGQPTEHYDVDAAIAEEDEIDLLSESSLSDELDRALEAPGDPSPATELGPEQEFEPETAAAPEPEEPAEPAESEAVAGASDESDEDTAVATGEVVEGEKTELADAEFFDQDDPLEGTPDFLEETPEHDRLWFEQKEPKDFDFGD